MKTVQQAYDATVSKIRETIHPLDPSQEQAFTDMVGSCLLVIEHDITSAIKNGQLECVSEVPTAANQLQASAITFVVYERLRVFGYTVEVVKSEYKLVSDVLDDVQHVIHTTFKIVWGRR